ncbi:MOSC and FAD-binding oxidoreductase domain-containing protein [Nonomuraea sp. NPDC048901]|uniref:MOSC and FAD-binding oxidoreductase domain-containing protein n=1 Tax=Nonomuraea sp. NPDC048901 TaxID=3155627 RepID=UPI0033C1C67E
MARLVSVNVGLPQDVAWQGKTVHTGVWKYAVAGPRMVRRLNVDGDGQGDLAGHGGEYRAVLVYQLDSYRHWQEHLGRDDFAYGQFGENFTVDGLPDDEVCIGDRFQVGEALFEVTQPRVTCYRVGLRMGEPQMAALLVSHRRPGFYLKVLVEGRVEAGQEFVKVASGPEGVTVADIDALLYLPGHSRRQLARALRIPALSPGWRTSLQALLDQADGASGAAGGNAGLAPAVSPPPAWPGFRPLRVRRIEAESASVFSVTLAALGGDPRSAALGGDLRPAASDGAPLPAASDGDPSSGAPGGGLLPAALPGQFLTVRVPSEGGGPSLIRSYSLSGPPGGGEYRLSIKQEPHGAASGYLRAHLRTGDVLECAAPRGAFTLVAGDGPVVLISAGIGATPVMAMLHTLAAERSPREVWWLYGARDGTEHPFADESRDLLGRLANAHRHVCYSRPAPGDRQGVDYHSRGRLSLDLLCGLGLPRGADTYVCGPPALMRDLPVALAASALAPSHVRTEIFGAGPSLTPGVTGASVTPVHPPAGPPGDGPAVSFARSGLTVSWSTAYTSLLELAEACDVPTRWSCRTGVCHNCESGLLAGSVDYSPEPLDAPAEGDALICCSRPREDVILDL